MKFHKKSIFDSFVEGIERFRKRIEYLVSALLTGVLRFLDRTYKWIVTVTKRIANYLQRLFEAIIKLFFALFKLLLFYIPSVILAILSTIYKPSKYFLIGAIIWAILITAIGLTYGKGDKDKFE